MNSKFLPFILSASSTLMLTSGAIAAAGKVDFPSPSPACTIKQHVGLTDIEVDYSRPGVKGRDIFGAMIPYGKVWRTGANQATKIIFSTPVKLNGTEVPAGTYAFLTIPGKDEWTIIINKEPEQWGAYKYDEKNDVARIKATPKSIDHSVETFAIDFGDLRDESAEMKLVWDKTVVPIKVEVNYVDKLTSEIESVMASNEEKKPYFQAAKFYYDHNLNLDKALTWVDAAIAKNDAHYMNFLKAQILAKKGDKAAAIKTSKHSLELSEKAEDTSYIKQNEVLLKTLQ